MMDKFMRSFSRAAHKEEISDLEFYFEQTQSCLEEICGGKLQKEQISDVQTCHICGKYKGYSGSVYIEDFSEEYFPEELQTMKECAEVFHKEYVPLELKETDCHEEAEKAKNQEIINVMMKMENQLKEKFPELKKLGTYSYEECSKNIIICNEQGVKMKDSNRKIILTIEVEAEKAKVIQTTFHTFCKKELSVDELKRLTEQAVRETTGMVDAEPVKTGKYPVILKNSVVSEMLSIYGGAFFADIVHSGLSKLKDKKGKKVASELVTIVEDPINAVGIRNRRFDDEGTVTQKKTVIEHGNMQAYIYNCEEARKDSCGSTGNGFRPDCKSEIETGVTNLIMEGEQKKSLATLCDQMKEGLYIVSCDGMFAGANPVSGDFSLISKGYIIKEGKLSQGVKQITVAGNFFELLKKIQGMASELHIMESEKGAFAAPDIYVDQLTISGL